MGTGRVRVRVRVWGEIPRGLPMPLPNDDYKPWVVAPETGGVNPAGESSPALEADEEGSPSVEREKSPSPSLEYVSEEPSEHYDRSPSPNPSEMDENVELGEASDASLEDD